MARLSRISEALDEADRSSHTNTLVGMWVHFTWRPGAKGQKNGVLQ
jgi:hypothetical protein